VALRLDPSAHLELKASLARSPRLSALHESWSAAPDAIPTIDAQTALSPILRTQCDAGARRVGEPAIAHAPRGDAGRDAAAIGARLNADQSRAASAISEAHGTFAPFLLQGVTGSGKTEVYLTAAAAAIAAGGQVLILVPEINLTPQFMQRMTDALPTHGNPAQPYSGGCETAPLGERRCGYDRSPVLTGSRCSCRCAPRAHHR
jgi:primosomal protein N' (replication factor Y)